MDPAVLPVGLRAQGDPLPSGTPTLEPGLDLATQLERIVARMERDLILNALERSNGKRQEAADLLGISRKTLHNKMVKHRLFSDEA